MSEEDNKCLYLASYVLGPGHRRLKAYGAFDFKHSCTHCGVKGHLKDFTFPNKRNRAFQRTFELRICPKIEISPRGLRIRMDEKGSQESRYSFSLNIALFMLICKHGLKYF